MNSKAVEIWEKTKAFLHARKFAYVRTFDPNSIYAQAVLTDLAKFCRAEKTTFHPDPRIHAALEGRREVFLRIANHLKLTPDQLLQIYAKGEQ